MRKLLIAIGAALAGLAIIGVPAVTASAASAATTPVIYNAGVSVRVKSGAFLMVGGWLAPPDWAHSVR